MIKLRKNTMSTRNSLKTSKTPPKTPSRHPLDAPRSSQEPPNAIRNASKMPPNPPKLVHFSFIFAFLSSKNAILVPFVTKILPKTAPKAPNHPKSCPQATKIYKHPPPAPPSSGTNRSKSDLWDNPIQHKMPSGANRSPTKTPH